MPALFVTLPAARPSPGVAVVLWTGGKDSALALHLARQSIRPVRELVTFVPRTGTFLAHPLPLMSAQAAALGLPHRLMTVEEPLAESYDRAIRWLQGQGVSALVTGDIDTVEGYPSWINERASSAGVEVVRPLWKRNRSELLGEMYRVGLRAVITAVRTPPVEIDWLGRLLDPRAIEDLCDLSSRRGFDPCGEQGEYHTMVLDGPGFAYPLVPEWKGRETVGQLSYLRFDSVRPVNLRPSQRTA